MNELDADQLCHIVGGASGREREEDRNRGKGSSYHTCMAKMKVSVSSLCCLHFLSPPPSLLFSLSLSLDLLPCIHVQVFFTLVAFSIRYGLARFFYDVV